MADIRSTEQQAPAYTSTSEKQTDYRSTDGSDQGVVQVSTDSSENRGEVVDGKKKQWYTPIITPGHAVQIVIAAVVALAIGLTVVNTIDGDVPKAAITVVGIPGALWLRALKAVVMPLIITAMIIAIQDLKAMREGGGKLAKWAIIYYLGTTCFAICHSTVMVSQVWVKLMTIGGADSLGEYEDKADFKKVDIADTVAELFNSFIPANIVGAVANNELLAVLITSIVVGYMLPSRDSSILRAVKEVEKLITKIITFLIMVAPIGVFFLILSNMFKLDIADIGVNLGVLIGASLQGMFLQLFVVYPVIYFGILRKNPYAYWFKCAPAWVTAWGTASSAATLPVTMKCARERGYPERTVKFLCPLGSLVNMDGTAIYFPICVQFLAATQGITLTAVQYIIVIILATLASIGTTPIPSSSLVLTIMIAESVNVPVTGMFAVIVAIDWFIDRFRTATNVTGDLYAVAVVNKIIGTSDEDQIRTQEIDRLSMDSAARDNTARV